MTVSRSGTAVATSGIALLGLVALAVTQRPRHIAPHRRPTFKPYAAVQSARRLNRAAGTIAAAVLADSAVEHYRGAFHNNAMITPLITAGLSLAVSVHGHADSRPVAHRFRDGV